MSCSRLDEKEVTATILKYQCILLDFDARNGVLGQIQKQGLHGLFVTYIDFKVKLEAREYIL